MDSDTYKAKMRHNIMSAMSKAVELATEQRDVKGLLETASLGGGLIESDVVDKRPMGFIMDEVNHAVDDETQEELDG